jgi:hypothetical protein
MKSAIFFAYLCFALLKMYDGTFTSVHHSASIQHIEKGQQPKLANAMGNYALVEDNDLNKEGELFIAEEIEDDDVNETFSKKSKLFSRCNLSFFHPFTITFDHCCEAPRPFVNLLSDKHIILRVLRI